MKPIHALALSLCASCLAAPPAAQAQIERTQKSSTGTQSIRIGGGNSKVTIGNIEQNQSGVGQSDSVTINGTPDGGQEVVTEHNGKKTVKKVPPKGAKKKKPKPEEQ